MAQFTHSLCEEVIRTEGRCGLSKNETTQMARLALRALHNENPWRSKYLALLDWLDKNMTFYDVNDGSHQNAPVLASVAKRVWYHATDDQESDPFTEVAARSVAKRSSSEESAA